MKEILKYKDFMKLFIANTLSRFGDSIDVIAYGFMVYSLTGSKILLATIYMFNVLPSILFSSFAGAVVDYFSKKKIVVFGDFVRGGLVILTAYLYYKEMLLPWHLFALTFLNSTIEAFVSPCKSATIPKLIDEKHYLFVNSTLQSVTKFFELIGLALGGAVIGWIGIPGAMLIDSGTFLISGAILLITRFPKEEKKVLTRKNYANSYKEGLSFVFKGKVIFSLVMSMALLNFLLTPINALAPAYASDILEMGPKAISYISIAFVIGNILGGIIVGKFGKTFSIKTLVALGLSLTGISYALMALPKFIGLFSPIYIACGAALSVGFFVTFASAGLSTFFMTYIPKEMMARVSSVMSMFALSAMPLGAMVSGIVSSIIGLEYLILLFGLLFVITTLLPLNALNHQDIQVSKDTLKVETQTMEIKAQS